MPKKENCYFCDTQAEYDQIVKTENCDYTVAGVCKNHLRMGLSV
jgi:hypothetical protein